MGLFSSRCDKCGSTEHSTSACVHGPFADKCRHCGSVDHASSNCPNGAFSWSKKCTKCGSTEHSTSDCVHPAFTTKCRHCGSANHASGDCPNGAFSWSKQCTKCGSTEHSRADCPQGLFASPPSPREDDEASASAECTTGSGNDAWTASGQTAFEPGGDDSSSGAGSLRSSDSRSSAAGAIVAMLTIVALGVAGWWINSRAESAEGGNSAGGGPAGLERVVIPDALPFEGAQLGRWIARESGISVYDQPAGSIVATLDAGEAVTALFSEIRAVPRRATVKRVYETDVANGITVGTTVEVLYPIGEGAFAVRRDGKVVDGSLDLAFDFELPLSSNPIRWAWWVRVRLADGSTGWLNKPGGRFDGMDLRG